MKYEDFLKRIGREDVTTETIMVKCPAHDDTTPSLSISKGDNGIVLLHCFGPGCSYEEIVQAFGISLDELKPSGCTLEQYSGKIGVPASFLLGVFGLTDKKYNKLPAVRVPYFDENGQELGEKFRVKLSGAGKYRYSKGIKVKGQLYNAATLPGASTDYMVVVEGESDVHTLAFNGYQSVGIPGADMFILGTLEKLCTFKKVYFIIEPDAGGQRILSVLSKCETPEKIFIPQLGVKDVNDLFTADPPNFKAAFDKALKEAESLKHYLAQKREKELTQEYLDAKPLLQAENILELFADTIDDTLIVGETQNAKLLYLCLTSRVLAKPVSVVVSAQSSTGKSYLAESVLKFFPAESYFDFSSMSEKALCYFRAPLSNKFIFIHEAPGMEEDYQNYLIRVLLSEGKIKYWAVEKQPDGTFDTTMKHIEGPTALLSTTTKFSLNIENMTRVQFITCDDSVEQTVRVLKFTAEESHPKIDFLPWHALQNYIAAGAHDVTIPFLGYIADNLPPYDVRLRRDISVLKALISTSAILHRETRSRDSQGNIIANIKDYRNVYEIFNDVLSVGLNQKLKKHLKPTLELAARVIKEKRYLADEEKDVIFTVQDISTLAKQDGNVATERTYRTHINELVSLGYFRNINKERGQRSGAAAHKYAPLREDVIGDKGILPLPSVVEDFLEMAAGEEPTTPAPDNQIVFDVKPKEPEEIPPPSEPSPEKDDLDDIQPGMSF